MDLKPNASHPDLRPNLLLLYSCAWSLGMTVNKIRPPLESFGIKPPLGN